MKFHPKGTQQAPAVKTFPSIPPEYMTYITALFPIPALTVVPPAPNSSSSSSSSTSSSPANSRPRSP